MNVSHKIIIIFMIFSGFISHNVFASEDPNIPIPISFSIEMTPWEKVDKLIPKYSKFTVIDFQTGASFNVQRRAGSRHADVQPLTTKDTKIMKKIYNGKWSWKRRAALILINDQLIAASIHGMPHGAGALQNNFPGHFCIHFLESTTHRSSHPDLGHHLMILKSAGKIEQYLFNIDSKQMINVFMTAINNDDYDLLKAITYSKAPNTNDNELKQLIDNIEIIQWEMGHTQKPYNHVIGSTIPVKVHMYLKGKGLQRAEININLGKSFDNGLWKVDFSSLTDVSSK